MWFNILGKLSPFSESQFPYLKNERDGQMVCKASLTFTGSDRVLQFTWEGGPDLYPLPSAVIIRVPLVLSKVPHCAWKINPSLQPVMCWVTHAGSPGLTVRVSTD